MDAQKTINCHICGSQKTDDNKTTSYHCGSYYNAKGRFIKSHQCNKIGRAYINDCNKQIFDKNISDAKKIMIENVKNNMPDIKAFLDINGAISNQGMVNYHWTYIKLLIEAYVEILITEK